jgi:antirestriction protein
MNERQPEHKQGRDESATVPQEQEPEEVARIYVASLSDYNDGRLHGSWVNAAVEPDELGEAVQAMLRTSPTPGAEEWAIHDYEGFGPLRLGEYEDFNTVSTIAKGIAEHGPAFAHWAAHIGSGDIASLVGFEDAYRGHWESVEAYVEDLLDDLGIDKDIEEAVPEYLQPYVKFDAEGFGRDLEIGGDITTSSGDGGVYIFDGRTRS